MITVLFSTFNGADTLPAMLESLTRQNPPPGGWKLVAVDNGSTDGSDDLLRSFTGRLPLTVLSEPAKGKNRALNRGLEIAEGELVVLTDDDIVARADWLTTWAAVADRLGEFDIFGGRIVPRWGTEPPDWLLSDVPLGPVYAVTDPAWEEGPIRAGCVWGPNMAVRCGVFEAGHRFDERVGPDGTTGYAMGSETEFTMRLERQGFRCAHSPMPVVEHQIPATSMTQEWVLRRAFRYGRGERLQQLAAGGGSDVLLFGYPRWIVRQWGERQLELMRASFEGTEAERFRLRWDISRLRGALAIRADEFQAPTFRQQERAQTAANEGSGEAPRFSVVIPSYNRAGYLAEAIRSAWNQTYPPHEIVVVDDGSIDDTPSTVEGLIRDGVPVRYLRQANQGVGAARNHGIRAATGDWIALLDSDDTWLPRKLETARTLIAAGDGVDFVHSRCVHDIELATGGVPEPVLTVEQRCNPAVLMDGWYIKTPSVAIRRSLLDQIGGLFPTDLRTCEDFELFWRAVTVARCIGYSPEPDVVIGSTPASLTREEATVLERVMDNIEAMSRVIRWLDGRPERARLQPVLKRRRYWAARILLTRAMREGRLIKMLGWLLRHGLSHFEIGRAIVSAGRGVVNGENPSGL
jgi:glycosyltransferase involved in cell wall biosynthesis